MKTYSAVGFIAGALLASSAYAAAPEISVSREAHPDMADAQKLARDAWTVIHSADQRKNPEAAAHLKKAKELLVQVNDEIRAAADASNAAKQERREEKKEKRQERREEKKEKKQERREERQEKKQQQQ